MVMKTKMNSRPQLLENGENSCYIKNSKDRYSVCI